MTKGELKIGINEITLENFSFKSIENSVNNAKELTVDIPKEKIETKNGELLFEINAVFVVKQEGLELSGKYSAQFIVNSSDKEILINIIENNKYQMAYPVICKITALISKITEEIRIFPIIISPEDWIAEELKENI